MVIVLIRLILHIITRYNVHFGSLITSTKYMTLWYNQDSYVSLYWTNQYFTNPEETCEICTVTYKAMSEVIYQPTAGYICTL